MSKQQELLPVEQADLPAPVHAQSESNILASIVEVARDPNANMDALEKLIALKYNDEDRQAKRAFDVAFTKMKPHLPKVIKGRKAHNSTYASIDDVNEAVNPILSEYGFSDRGIVSQTDKAVSVTIILSHIGGHREEATFTVDLDTSGSKNRVQAMGSSTTYARRYAKCAMLDITLGDAPDNDGNGAEQKVTGMQAQTLLDVFHDCSKAVQEEFVMHFPDVSHVPRNEFTAVLNRLKADRAKTLAGAK